ncbi:geranylgeranyl reductase family protein [Roseovarius sp. S4756]|uniref:geranylgeranyl reductase family protein n=1 Tax=Roseovarius maritimus TaxID=3342637 RepID=UPI0037296EEA
MAPTLQTFDLLILGAGPAGTAAAVTACRAGLSTAIIDKATFPRTKLCGGLVTGRSAALYRDIFGAPLNAALFEPRERITFHANGAPLGGDMESPPVYLAMRWDMDAHLLDMARAAGTADFTGQRITDLDTDALTVTLADGDRLAGRILIGADGVNSPVARALFGRAFDQGTIGFAMEIEAPPLAPPERDVIRIDLGAADWGYGWQFPKAGSTTIGVGGLNARNPDMKGRLDAYRDILCEDGGARIKGHFLPFGAYRRVPGRGRVLLAGDAAGLVDPITGEGIAYALQSGAAAATAAADALSKERPDAALSAYRRALKPVHRALAMACWLRPLIYSARTRPFFLRAFAASSVLKGAYLDLLAGHLEYPAICRLAVRRMPRAIWRHRRRG